MYGDNAAGALVDETGEEDDLRREMICQALQGQSNEALGEMVSLFTDPQPRMPVVLAANTTDSPIAGTPRLTIFDLLFAQAKGDISIERKILRQAEML